MTETPGSLPASVAPLVCDLCHKSAAELKRLLVGKCRWFCCEPCAVIASLAVVDGQRAPLFELRAGADLQRRAGVVAAVDRMLRQLAAS